MKTIKTKEDVMRIKSMRTEGYTTKEIAKTFNVTPRVIFYWIKRLKDAGIEAHTIVKRGSKALQL